MIITYRTPTQTDIPKLAALHVRCWQQAYVGLIDAEFLSSLSIEQRVVGWQRTLADAEVFKHAAFFDNQPIGFVTSGPTRDTAHGDSEIYALYLDQEFHGRQIGYTLCASAMQDWRKRGGKIMKVNVLSDNQRARKFYEHVGFSIIAEGQWATKTFTLPEKIMALNFPPLSPLPQSGGGVPVGGGGV